MAVLTTVIYHSNVMNGLRQANGGQAASAANTGPAASAADAEASAADAQNSDTDNEFELS